MHALYDITGGNEFKTVEASKVFAALGLALPEDSDLLALLQFLYGEGLVEISWTFGTDQTVQITHIGVREVEQSLAKPDLPTEHFAAFTHVEVHGDVHNSNIAAGSTNVVQVVAPSADEVRAWAEKVIEVVNSDDSFPHADRTLVLLNAEALRDQSVNLVAVDRNKLRALGAVVLTVLQGMAGNAAYAGLVAVGQSLF